MMWMPFAASAPAAGRASSVTPVSVLPHPQPSPARWPLGTHAQPQPLHWLPGVWLLPSLGVQLVPPCSGFLPAPATPADWRPRPQIPTTASPIPAIAAAAATTWSVTSIALVWMAGRARPATRVSASLGTPGEGRGGGPGSLYAPAGCLPAVCLQVSSSVMPTPAAMAAPAMTMGTLSTAPAHLAGRAAPATSVRAGSGGGVGGLRVGVGVVPGLGLGSGLRVWVGRGWGGRYLGRMPGPLLSLQLRTAAACPTPA